MLNDLAPALHMTADQCPYCVAASKFDRSLGRVTDVSANTCMYNGVNLVLCRGTIPHGFMMINKVRPTLIMDNQFLNSVLRVDTLHSFWDLLLDYSRAVCLSGPARINLIIHSDLNFVPAMACMHAMLTNTNDIEHYGLIGTEENTEYGGYLVDGVIKRIYLEHFRKRSDT